MIRGQKTEDRRQMVVHRAAARIIRLRGKAATNNQSSVLSPQSSELGFTLIEMIVVMVITGIIGGMIAIFIRAPVQSYVDSSRRAEMTDIADTALRRISRDLRLALPNSVRVNSLAGVYYLDLLYTTGGGRYRASGTGAACAPNDALNFSAADTCFEVLGSQIQFQANDQVVVYNLGIAGADAYEGNAAATHVRRPYNGGTAVPVSFVSLTSPNRLPFASPSHRFHVVHYQVRYICNPTTGELTRYWWAANSIVAPGAIVPAGVGISSALLATHVGGCSFAYEANVVAERTGVMTMQLTITNSGESVTLYNATHVSNEP